MNRSFPKEFLLTREKFLRAVDKLCKKHGYWQWYIMTAEKWNETESDFHANINVVTDGMLESITESVEDLMDRYGRED